MKAGIAKFNIVLFSVLAAITPLAAQRTDPGAYVPGPPGSRMPNSFTGTYNIVEAYVKPFPPPAASLPPTQITWAELKVNGTVVKTYQQPTTPPVPIHLAFQISNVIDSTAFPHGTLLTVEINAIDEYGRSYHATNAANTTNLFRSFEHQDAAENGVEPVSRMLSVGLTGYQFVSNIGPGWSRGLVEHSHNQSSVVFFATHGLTGAVEANPSYGQSEYVGASTMWWARVGAHGSGFWPFNSGAPKTSVVITLSCCTGATGDFYQGWFWPFEDAYGGWTVGQAGHGYSSTTWWSHFDTHSTDMWAHLKEGKTLWTMRQRLIQTDTLRHRYGLPANYPVGTPNQYFTTHSQGPIWGDFFAKVKGVYTADDTVTLAWFRS
jgi:hypothetical protein